MKGIHWGLLFLSLLLGSLLGGIAVANPIFYEAVNEGGDQWRYNYTIGNETSFEIEQFTVYFDYDLYEFSLVASQVDPNVYEAPGDWDAFVAPTDIILDVEEDGFFDAFSLVDLVVPGDLISGFSVSFTYLGSGMPGSQFFEFFGFDVDGNEVSGDSFTELMSMAQPVPEPGTLVLMGLGLLVFLGKRTQTIR